LSGPYRLVALDIDGTLVDRSLILRPRNLAALRHAIGTGVAVVLATGRMFRSALPYAVEIGTNLPVICYQGAVVRPPAGDTLREWAVPPAAAGRAVALARELKLHVNLYQDDEFFVEDLGEGAQRYAAVAQVEPRYVGDLMEIAARGSTKVVYVGDHGALRGVEDRLRSEFEPGCRVTFSLPEFLEVVDAAADKGTALSFVCDRLGIPAGEVIAAGDAPNDIEMLRYAGLALAPRDAFPEAIAAADDVIAPPGEDGIAELVERYLA
jgi:Cof subfamily protein (haloacid dehalogenase superfamily)